MKMETIKEAGLRHKEGIRHYQDRKSHCDEDFKEGACWLAEYLMSIPFNEILEELVELKEDIDYDRRTICFVRHCPYAEKSRIRRALYFAIH